MPNTIKAGAVLFAKDVERVAQFYQAVVAMSVAHSEAGLIVLESESAQLIVHGIPKRIANAIEIVDPPKLRDQIAVKLVFPVVSIAQARAKAPIHGGLVQPKSKEFQARGFRACDGYDPEGNVIQVRERAS